MYVDQNKLHNKIIYEYAKYLYILIYIPVKVLLLVIAILEFLLRLSQYVYNNAEDRIVTITNYTLQQRGKKQLKVQFYKPTFIADYKYGEDCF